jgi:hypothetical protein
MRLLTFLRSFVEILLRRSLVETEYLVSLSRHGQDTACEGEALVVTKVPTTSAKLGSGGHPAWL